MSSSSRDRRPGAPATPSMPGPEIGYHLSSEEHAPNDLIDHARRAEELGFSFIAISDHFRPWVPKPLE